MKKFGLIFLIFVLLFSLATVHATAPRLVDDADLLTDDEESILIAELDRVSETHGVDVVIVTTNTLEGKSPTEYADDYYDYHDYSEDGVLLLISMDADGEHGDYWISTCGYCLDVAFTDAGIEYLEDQIEPDLIEHDFAGAFASFVETAENILVQAETGDPYDIHNIPEIQLPKTPLDLTDTVVCAVIAVIFGLIVIGSMKKKMKTVSYQRAATQYVRPGSLNVTLAQDFFLYRTVTRVARPKESSSSSGGGSSSHTSSSGRSHGGGGGRF